MKIISKLKTVRSERIVNKNRDVVINEINGRACKVVQIIDDLNKHDKDTITYPELLRLSNALQASPYIDNEAIDDIMEGIRLVENRVQDTVRVHAMFREIVELQLWSNKLTRIDGCDSLELALD